MSDTFRSARAACLTFSRSVSVRIADEPSVCQVCVVARDSVQVLPEGAFGELLKKMLASWLVHVLDTVTLV